MQKKFILFCVIPFIFILAACNKKIDFVEDGPFMLYTGFKGGENYYLDFFPHYIEVYHDGQINIFTEATEDIYVGEDAPTRELKIPKSEVKALKQAIEASHFFTMDKNITDARVDDAGSSYITVYAKDKERKVGGNPPKDEKFKQIIEILFNQVFQEYYEWIKETEEYIYEVNPE